MEIQLKSQAFLQTFGATIYSPIDQRLAIVSSTGMHLLLRRTTYYSTVKFVNSKIFNNIVPDYADYQEHPFEYWKDDINTLLTQYIQTSDAVKFRAGLSIALQISQKGNMFLQSNTLSNKLAENKPSKCAAVIGFAINLIHLLSSIIAPYMPETAKSICAQLRADPLPILDYWNADSIKPGHEIGTAVYLFSTINPRKGQEWRELFGSEEAGKVKEEEATRKATKKAARKAAKSSSKEAKQ